MDMYTEHLNTLAIAKMLVRNKHSIYSYNKQMNGNLLYTPNKMLDVHVQCRTQLHTCCA